MEMDSEILYESIDTSDITIDETSFAWVVENAIRSTTPSVSGTSRIPSFASIIDSAIRSRTPSNFGASPVHSFAAAGESRNIATRLSQPVSKVNLKFVTLPELVAATNNFSTENKIGDGSFGVVYRGKLIDGREVAIKRGKTNSYTNKFQENVFGYRVSRRQANEIEYYPRVHHKNLVRLLGSYYDKKERILVYKYIKNGSLSDNLHKLQNSALMSWPARIQVALEAARGIEYLHLNHIPPIIHGDIKSANILLDSNWNAKVSDFGLSPMDSLPGTVGYLDPELHRCCHLTPNSEVYSFGVVLLELISGLTAIHKNENEIPRNVVDVAVPFIVQDEIHKVLNPRVPPPTPFQVKAVADMGYLAADCVSLNARDRPTMAEVASTLEIALMSPCLFHPIMSSSSQ